MPSRKKKTAGGFKISDSAREELHQLLDLALEKRMDFVLAFEECKQGVFGKMHAMNGRLITPCMLGTLQNRVELQEDEGALYRCFEI